MTATRGKISPLDGALTFRTAVQFRLSFHSNIFSITTKHSAFSLSPEKKTRNLQHLDGGRRAGKRPIALPVRQARTAMEIFVFDTLISPHGTRISLRRSSLCFETTSPTTIDHTHSNTHTHTPQRSVRPAPSLP